MYERIDPKPFEASMPASVRKVIAQARSGRGPALRWLKDDETGMGAARACFPLLRGEPPLAPEVVGWLVGMAMFVDEANALPKISVRERIAAPAPFAVDAFVAGIRADVPSRPRQWKGIEALVGLIGRAPPALAEALPAGLVSESGIARASALRLARRLGEPAIRAVRRARKAAEGTAAKRLDEALAALGAPTARPVDRPTRSPAKSDRERLLGRLLREWRKTHDAALEPAIVRTGAAVGALREPVKARSKGEVESAWLSIAAAKDPADVDRLLAVPWPGAWKTALDRVIALKQFPGDPRIVKAMAAARARYTSRGGEAVRRIAAKIVDAAAAAPRRKADPALLAESGATGPSAGLGPSWAAVWKSPADFSARLVLADALQAAGDPRGELIALQFALAEGRADAKAAARVSRLLSAHADAWTGNLPAVDGASRRFERGFLVSLRSKATDEALATSATLEEWRTVEELELENVRSADSILPLLRGMPSLRVLACRNPGVVEELAASKGSFPSIRALGEGHRFPAGGSALPGLRVYLGRWFDREWSDGETREELERISRAGVAAIVAPDSSSDRIERVLGIARKAGSAVELRFVTGLGRRFGFHPSEWSLRARPKEGRADLMWGGGHGVLQAELPDLLERLVRSDFRTIAVSLPRVRAPGDWLARSERLAKKLGKRVAVRFDGAPFDLAAVP